MLQKKATLIDNFLCKFTSRFYDHSSGILLSDISNHLPYFICLNSGVSRQNTSVLIEIKPSGESIDNFRKEIMDSNVAASLDQHPNADPDANYNIIHNTIEQLKEKHLASEKVKYNKHKHQKSSWITTGIIKSIKFRDKLYKINKNITYQHTSPFDE